MPKFPHRSPPTWSRPLPRPLALGDVMTLRTIGDVRDLIAKHLPPGHRARPSWQHVVAELDKAAAGADPLDVSIALRMTLELQGVPCRPA